MVTRNMRGTTSAAAATIRAVGTGQRQGSCDHAGGLRSRERDRARAPEMPPNRHQQPTTTTGSNLRTWR
jgi:hypothetical protein